MILLLLFTLMAGFVTILAPCIWPLLPIILSASIAGSQRKSLGLVLGIMSSFSIFTLSISYLEKVFPIDPNIFRIFAVVAIGLFGLMMVIPSLGTKFEDLMNALLRPFNRRFKFQGTGFAAGYAIGFSTGLVWAPCSGPILATVATLAATQAVNIKVVLVAVTYVVGLGIPLFFFSRAGAWFFEQAARFTKYTDRVRQAFGVLMIVAALLIYTNDDKALQLKILNLFPSHNGIFVKIENNPQVSQELLRLRGGQSIQNTNAEDLKKLPDLGKPADFTGIAEWLNTPKPLSLADLRGKVVLIDFWTYSCINCIRTMPHLTAWYEKYNKSNFIVIGVHTPEFAFEKETKNVQAMLKQLMITYPVAQDNDYKTWRAYNNEYWPAEYLIDAKGRLRHIHFGEGDYDATEQAIRQLLKEAGYSAKEKVSVIVDQMPTSDITPETYLGKARMERFASPENPSGGQQKFTVPGVLPENNFAYDGAWDISDEAAVAQKGSGLEIRFKADKVFLVISPRAAGDRIKLLIDGKSVSDAIAGADVKSGELVLDGERLYHLIDLKGKIESHRLRLEFQSDATAVFAFTFG